MEIEYNKKDNTSASIKVRLNKDDFQPQVDKKIKEYARKMNLKGFRPGKVPPGVVRKMYGKSILVEEVNHILSHKVNDYIKENDIQILGEPIPKQETTETNDWDNPENLVFDYELGLIDDFKIDISKKDKVKKYLIEVDKGALEDTLKDIRQRFGTEEEGDKVQAGDVIEANVKEEKGEYSKEEVSIPFDKLDKKAAAAFKGAEKGAKISFDISKLSSDDNLLATIRSAGSESEGSEKGTYEFEIKGIKRQVEAKHDQELFDKVFGAGVVSNEKDYIEKVKETIAGNYNRESENFHGLNVRKYLLDKVKIDLPDTFLKDWLKVKDEKITDEDLDREYQGYADGLKWNLIQNKIAKENDIKVEHEDVRAEAKKMIIEQFGGSQAVASIEDKMDGIVDNYLQGEEGKHYQNIYDNLYSQKIMDVVKEQIGTNDKKVSVEEFTKIVNEESSEK